jgi:sulfatase maturation enzyme AslB (radical SAM superfamily)
MPNAVLTEVCNKRCAYCFAADTMAASSARFMGLEAWSTFLDWLDRSGIEEARIVGGEPTLHPRFPEVVAEAAARGKRLVVFSNGLMPARSLAALAALPAGRCKVVMNTHEPPDRNRHELERQAEVVRALPGQVMLGYNLYRLPFDMDFMLPLFRKWPLERRLRVGLALPMLGSPNACLRPHQYPVAGARLGRFARAATQLGVVLELDCGFVRCMFDDQAIAALEANSAGLRFSCAPILDVAHDGSVIHCFALGDHCAQRLDPEGTVQSVDERFRSDLGAYRTAGIYPECTDCEFRKAGQCAAGCLSHVIPRFRHTPFSLSVSP